VLIFRIFFVSQLARILLWFLEVVYWERRLYRRYSFKFVRNQYAGLITCRFVC
jgi:hypothetical protein